MMRAGKWLIIAVIAGMAVGCVQTSGQQAEQQPSDAAAERSSAIPEWPFDSFKQKFSQPDLIDKEDVTLVTLRMNRTRKSPEIAAFLTTSHLEGWFVLYAEENGVYKEVYAKQEPVYGVQVHGAGDQMISFLSGVGGSGVQKNNFHLLSYTQQGYKEVWSGLAYDLLANGPPPFHQTIGTIYTEDNTRKLYYQQTTYIFNEDISRISSTKQLTHVYHYDEEKSVYTSLPETGRE
ncbi:hypothetical protein FOI68_05300 [Brevibacillus sp. LEMMJ03]|uniref:hypothetical protein n=1 Tax=Brevibacillus sp. LEMMJ03 TaxID=2595056 RepID=UPI00117F33A4|nr:hypothetical protein [Brevibacillus sp. LEMMJ03]TRY26991.1 hypothetical protein FOI68_05300 [Brevibacillus sp. LEMMJ03]